MGPRAGLDAVTKRELLCPHRDSKLGRPPSSLVTILTELLRFPGGGEGKRFIYRRKDALNVMGWLIASDCRGQNVH
jgi:hypothetical protein